MNVNGKTLRAYVERWQTLDAAKAEAADDQKALLDDMEKNDNIERKPFKTLIRYLKDEEDARHQLAKFNDLLATYLNFENTPLGKVAAEKDDTRISLQMGDGPVTDITEAIRMVRSKSVR